MKTKPFNLEEAKAGAQIITRSGKQVKLLVFDSDVTDYPILGVIYHGFGNSYCGFTNDGAADKHHENNDDLFIVYDEPEELTEFEKELVDLVSGWCDSHIETPEEYINKHSKTLLDIARKQIYEEFKGFSKLQKEE